MIPVFPFKNYAKVSERGNVIHKYSLPNLYNVFVRLHLALLFVDHRGNEILYDSDIGSDTDITKINRFLI